MKYLILNPMLGTPETSIVSSMKIAVFLRDFLDAQLVTGKDYKNLPDIKSDILFFVNASTTFTKPEMREYIPYIIKKSKCCIYIQNDYLLVPRPLWRNATKNFIWWTIVQRRVKSEYDRLINFNVLTYDPIKKVLPYPTMKTLFYYGSCRPGRVDDMQEYLDNIITTISASSHVAKHKFEDILSYPSIYFDKSKSIIEQIHNYSLSLYMLDKTTVRHAEMPANRFYESLSARRAMVFDYKAEEMFKKCGYDITPYIVRNSKDIKNMMKHSEKIAKEQWKKWSKDYVGELKKTIRKEIANIQKNLL